MEAELYEKKGESMTAIEKLVSIARGELGYREKNSAAALDSRTAGAGGGNITKYARDLDALGDFYNGPKQGYAWCDVFVDWCFVQAFGVATAKKLLCQPDRSAGAGCTYSLAYYNQRGQFHRTGPQPGDQIFFGSVGDSNHTGIVTEVSGGQVHTIEGNSSDGVFERVYAVGAGNIAGYGRPDWSLAGDVSGPDTQPEVSGGREPEEDPYRTGAGSPEPSSRGAACTVTLPELWTGCVGEAVRSAQLLLIGRGCGCGPDGADGDFGANTKAAVLRFQRDRGLEDDGIIGVNTWRSLIAGK